MKIFIRENGISFDSNIEFCNFLCQTTPNFAFCNHVPKFPTFFYKQSQIKKKLGTINSDQNILRINYYFSRKILIFEEKNLTTKRAIKFGTNWLIWKIQSGKYVVDFDPKSNGGHAIHSN